MSLKRFIRFLLPIIPALVLYSLLADQLNFTQDDAYISYRYAANYLNGDGLVFNTGERVEGFTNFGWVVYLIFWGALKVDYIVVSRVTGFLVGGGIIILTYLIALLIFGDRHKWYSLLPVYLLSVNLSLAYWSPAGLETATFAFLVMLSLYLFLRRSWLLIAALTLTVWVRPEGALLAGVLIVVEMIVNRKFPSFSLGCAAVALLISIPFLTFKLLYYGSIFPNPFYAKTGWNLEQLSNGFEYAGRFFGHYGFYGAGFLVSLVFIRKMSLAARAVWLFALLYIAYIVLIGGDVLRVHRFFLPVMGPVAIVTALALWLLVGKLRQTIQYALLGVAALPLLVLTYYLPQDYVKQYNHQEKAFTRKMSFLATEIKKADTTAFSVALPTIGTFGYELLGHEIIDMVGLTDSTIARHSEEPIPGMLTTWKEQKHNSRYLLRKAPNYIVFSTGVKPSAPAERALLLFPQFLWCYRAVGWYQPADEPGKTGNVRIAFKRMRDVTGDLVPTYPVAYVQHYKAGLDEYAAHNYRGAIKEFDQAIAVSPQPYYPYLLHFKAFCHMLLDEHDVALPLMNAVIAQDSLIFETHRDLYLYDRLMADTASARIHETWLKKLVPWYWPRIKTQAEGIVARARRSSP